MKRVTLFVLFSMLVPAAAMAQAVPPPPPPPPPVPFLAPLQAVPLPPTAPMPPTPPAAPMPMPMELFPSMVDLSQLDALRDLRIVDIDAARDAAFQAAQSIQQSQAMRDAYQVRVDQGGQFMTMGSTPEATNYNSGLNRMSQKQYEQAITSFDKVIAAKSAHADGALYHKAWCQAKLGKADEATATLAELRRSYASSPYVKDARALEADVRKLGPDQVDQDDLKLLAIQAMQSQSPDQAIPLLEGVLNNSKNSLQLKSQALFVLATLDNPRAHQILVTYAKGAGIPDLQAKAIGYLGSRGQKTSSAELIDIYSTSSDVDVRKAVINAFARSGDKSSLISIASGTGFGARGVVVSGGGGANAVTSGSGAQAAAMAGAGAGAGAGRGRGAASPNLVERQRAINGLTDLASPQELWPLYQKEDNRDLRLQWVSAFSTMGATDQLMQIVSTEKDPAVRLRAVRSLGNMRSEKTGPTLVQMYATGDRDTRSAVISALGNQNSADSLIAIFGKESDPQLKREIVQRLSEMAKTSKPALDFLMSLIVK